MNSENFAALFAAADVARRRAYARYSHFYVGAAVLTESGRIHAGCNVENAAYPQSQCAEASAVGVMVAAGDHEIREVVVIGGAEDDGQLCSPCGGCRQRLREFAAGSVVVHLCGPEGLRRTTTMDELLPYSFGPQNLPKE